MSEPRLLGRVVATEKKPNTAHEFHFWTSVDSPIGIGTIVRVDSATPVNGVLPRVYGVVVEHRTAASCWIHHDALYGLYGWAYAEARSRELLTEAAAMTPVA